MAVTRVDDDTQRWLLDEKNVLNEQVVEKYRIAGRIAQTAVKLIQERLSKVMVLLSGGLEPEKLPKDLCIPQLCFEADEFIYNELKRVYKKSVEERGIAQPTTIDKNNVVSGYSPDIGSCEFDSIRDTFKIGDVVKITLGAHLDGYAALVSHTVIIADQTRQAKAVSGRKADVSCAAYVATEAVITYLSAASGGQDCLVPKPIQGSNLRELVETIAKSFKVSILPGSRIRRTRRFLIGQLGSEDGFRESDYKGVVWPSPQSTSDDENSDNFVVSAGEAWLIDIKMTSGDGSEAQVDKSLRPTILTRDYKLSKDLKIQAARALLPRITTVFPTKLDQLVWDVGGDASSEVANVLRRQIRLGLGELLRQNLLVPQEVMIDKSDGQSSNKTRQRATVAREMSTVLILAGTSLRLTGGQRVAPYSWVSSDYEIRDDRIKSLLEPAKLNVHIKQVVPFEISYENIAESDKMEE